MRRGAAMTPSALRSAAAVAVAGCIAAVLADMISWFLANGYNPVAQTISDLAVGPSSWLMDLGLWCFSVAAIALTLALWPVAARARYGWLSMLCLVLLAVDVAVIAQVNEYAGEGNPGADIHQWGVYALGVLFPGAALAAIPALRDVSGKHERFSLAMAVAWIILGPFYMFVPSDSWNGAAERVLALIMLAWVSRTARHLRRRAGPLTAVG